jgi:hypothetical protein
MGRAVELLSDDRDALRWLDGERLLDFTWFRNPHAHLPVAGDGKLRGRFRRGVEGDVHEEE